MFARTFSTLGRLFRWGSATPEERRSWARHACDVVTTCQPAGDATQAPLPVRVRNISQGGLSAEVARPFRPGELLTVRLPAAQSEIITVLACVVRSRDLGNGRWGLGCTFSAELTANDLRLFDSQPSADGVSEQRAAERFAGAGRASFQLVNNADAQHTPATLINVSMNGAALCVSAPLSAGELVSLELRSPDGALIVQPLACVVRVTQQPDGEWLLGCNFMSELSEEQLQQLL
jgi:hypothetical protein